MDVDICEDCHDNAYYIIWYRHVIVSSSANNWVKWEMIINPAKSNRAGTDGELEQKDLFTLYEDAFIEEQFNPYPVE